MEINEGWKSDRISHEEIGSKEEMRVFIQEGVIMAIPRWKHGPAEDIPVESYTTAISKASIVDVVPAGTLISSIGKKKKTSKVWYEKSPIELALDIGTFFPKVIYGTLTDDVDIIVEAVETGAELTGAIETFEAEDVVLGETGVYRKKKTKTYEKGPGPIPGIDIPIKMPEIKFPEFPDIFGGLTNFLGGLGKGALVVGAALVGGYLLLKKK